MKKSKFFDPVPRPPRFQTGSTPLIQATISEELAKGPYVTARVWFKPVILPMQCTELTTEPPSPLCHHTPDAIAQLLNCF